MEFGHMVVIDGHDSWALRNCLGLGWVKEWIRGEKIETGNEGH